MPMGQLEAALLVSAACLLIGCAIANPYGWMGRDAFDEIMDKMNSVNEQNCHYLSIESLRLPINSLGQVPQLTKLPQIVIFPNRTKLIHVHNMALNRGYFYSYILQKLNESEVDFPQLPGFMYYYLSAAASVTASPGLLNGSATFFDLNSHYANFFTNLDFNKTVPLFAPKAWRLDDYNDNLNWLREPTNNTITMTDLGAGRFSNYSSEWHRLHQLFLWDTDLGIQFLHDKKDSHSERKHQYDVTIYPAKATGVMSEFPAVNGIRKFFGPPSPGVEENYQPVYFSRPYFDCGRSNIWQVTAVSPVIDFMDRYSNWTHLRYPKYVAVATTDIDFLRIDFDPCARTSIGVNVDKTYFSGVARCRPTTTCEPLPGFGFKRGGYMCHCKPGFRYPYWQNGPFMGVDLEQADASEAGRFECIPVGWQMQRLTTGGIQPAPGSGGLRRRKRSAGDLQMLMHLMRTYNATSMRQLRQKVEEVDRTDRTDRTAASGGGVGRRLLRAAALAAEKLRNSTSLLRRRRRSISTVADYGDEGVFYLGRMTSFDPQRYSAVQQLMANVRGVTKENCGRQLPERLVLPGEVGFGAERQFEVQARSALRLAHFLSAFMQNVNPDELYGNLRGDRYLNREQLYGEAFSNLMADKWVLSSGIYFDRDAFWDPRLQRTLEYFGPTAVKTESQQSTESGQRRASFVAEDAAGWQGGRAYFLQEWFRKLKERWASNSYGLEQFVAKPYVRSDINGTMVREHQRFPLYFRAPRYEDMHWSKPYFDCKVNANSSERRMQQWVVTVSAPFFGNSEHNALKFAGVVAVSVPLSKLDVNMCPGSFYQANFFKNSAPCHYESTFCVPITRNSFLSSDSFKCECRQGYEYPFIDNSVWFFAGGTISGQYEKNRDGGLNFYRTLRCREASGTAVAPTLALAASAAVASILLAAGSWL